MVRSVGSGRHFGIGGYCLLFAISILLALAACARPSLPSATPTPSIPSDTPAPPPSATPPAQPAATPTPTPVTVWLEPGAPQPVVAAARALLSDGATGTIAVTRAADATLLIGRDGPDSPISVPPADTSKQIVFERVYVPVVPFPTFADDITWTDVQRFWAGQPDALKTLTNDGSIPSLFLAPDTLASLSTLLGEPSPAAPIQVVPAAELVERAWAARPSAWAIVPFDALEPRWKVLRLDGTDIFNRALDLSRYPLALRWSVAGPRQGVAAFVAHMTRALTTSGIGATNRDPASLTVVAMTGTTAIARHSSEAIERSGDPLYPARAVADVLRRADVVHVSNEVPFYDQCPPGSEQGMSFCSQPAYFNILTYAGVNVVELTGNHLLDKGVAPFLHTLDMYDQAGMVTFGGGRDIEAALKPARIENHGNKLAFLGCNPVGPAYDWATSDSPGAAPCDYAKLTTQLESLRQQGYLVIFTFQWEESYQTEPLPSQVTGFRQMIAAGATIVSGSQAHQPQAIEFYRDGLIMYGLGNLFFDQMWSLGTRQGLIARHVVYHGRHIATDLVTTLLQDYAQPVPTSGADRQALLKDVFGASGW